MGEISEPTLEHHPVSRWPTLFLGLSGAYANSVAWGFAYGHGNHEFELPMVNWLRDPSLYPHDPVCEAFARFPTVFWPVVAYLSHWLSTEKVVMIFFAITKILFFLAVAEILRPRVKDTSIRACIILSIALSPFLNDQTPLGASNILDSTQTQSSLAIALLLWAACFLLEKRWIPSAIICGLCVYVSALFFVFMLFAFAFMAVVDWRTHQKSIIGAGLLGGAISVPWLLLFHSAGYREFPNGYVEALLAFYPFHLTLGSHEGYEIFSGLALLAAAALMAWIAQRAGQPRDFRLEVLAASFLLPVLLGALFGEFHLTPTLARLQLLRADSFLILFAMLLIQTYGANLLHTSSRIPVTTCLLSSAAVLLPLSPSLGLLWLLLVVMFLWSDPKARMENLWRTKLSPRAVRGIGLATLLTGALTAWFARAEWSLTVVMALILLAGCFFFYGRRSVDPAVRLKQNMFGVCIASILIVAMAIVPRLSSFWNPSVAPTAIELDWRALQEWAKSNTPPDAQFLAPTSPGGFREFSERSSWGEWKDGQAMYLYPPFAEEYRRRMQAVGYTWGKWKGSQAIAENYRLMSWERLLELARENHLNYIIQFREVVYPAAPIFSNQHYAVYKVVF